MTALVPEPTQLLKVQPDTAKDDDQSSYEYSEEDSYMYSDEVGGKDKENKGGKFLNSNVDQTLPNKKL